MPVVGSPDWGGGALQGGENPILNQSNLFFTAGQTRTFTAAVGRPGYIVRMHLWHSAAGGGVMPVKIQLTWVDLSMNAVMAVQTFWVFAGDPTTHHVINGQGPVAGTQLQLAITNGSALAQNMDADIFMVETTGYYTAHLWQTDDSGGFVIPGLNAVTSDVNAGIVAEVNAVSVPASSTTTLVMPLFSGQAAIRGHTLGANAVNIFANTAAESNPTFNDTVWQIAVVNSQDAYLPVYMPRVQCTLGLNNTNGAAAETVNAMLVSART